MQVPVFHLKGCIGIIRKIAMSHLLGSLYMHFPKLTWRPFSSLQ